MNKKIKNLPSNFKFGIFFSLVFFVLGFYLFLKNSFLFAPSFALSTIFLIISFFKPDLLLPLNKIWMKLGFFIGFFVKPIVLGIIFFFMFTPVAMIMKLFKRDELLIRNNNFTTFWKNKDQQLRTNFEKQF